MIVRRELFRYFTSILMASAFPAAVRAYPASGRAAESQVPGYTTNIEDLADTIDIPKIIVIGVGGGGCNAVEHMLARGVKGADFICVNTNAQNLKSVGAQKIIQLGNSGLSTGGNPDLASFAASEAEMALRSAMSGAHLVFITAGFGGGTGTGATPVIARIAKNMGILTVGVITQPFEFEGPCRVNIANAGLAALEPHVDTLIVMPNEKLLKYLGDDVTMSEAFSHTNDSIKDAIAGFLGILNAPGYVNVDFEEVRHILTIPGHAALGTAMATGMNCARIAAEKSLIFSAMDGVDLSKAKGVFVMISAAKGTLKLSDAKLAMNTIRAHTLPSADFFYGTFDDEYLNEGIRVTMMATGLEI